MIKTLTNLLKQDKEKFVVPKGVQDCIPITAIYDDGIFRVGKDKYSKDASLEQIKSLYSLVDQTQDIKRLTVDKLNEVLEFIMKGDMTQPESSTR